MNSTSNFDFSIEIGKFIIASIFQVFREIKGNVNTDDKSVILKLKTMKPLMLYLSYFKGLHNLAQKYLDLYSPMLFGDEDAPLFCNSLDINRINKIWKTYYENNLKKEIHGIKNLNKIAFQGAENCKVAPDYTGIPGTEFQLHLESVGDFAEKANASIKEFISHIEDIACSIEDSNFGGMEGWNEGVQSLAKKSLSASDEVILHLVPMIDNLYFKVIGE